MHRRWIGLIGSGLVLGLGMAVPRAALAQEDATRRSEALRVEQSVDRMLAPAVAATVLVRAVLPQGGFGSGSGVIVSREGEIYTCAHVVDMPGAALSVRLSDGRTYAAKLRGKNSVHDYALIQIEDAPDDLPVAPVGDSAGVAAGDWVVAMGHPLRPNRDNQPTVSVGVVRALHQKLAADMGRRRYPDVIMHDAPLFSGNSGGPLFDLHGRVVGINAAITLLNENGFAVPVQRLQDDLAKLRAGESLGPEMPEARTPTIDRTHRGGGLPGLITKPVPDDVARHFGFDTGQGDWISEIQPDTLAARSGLRVNDIVLALDGKDLPSGALHDELDRRPPRSQVRLLVLRRNGEDGFVRVEVPVRIGRAR